MKYVLINTGGFHQALSPFIPKHHEAPEFVDYADYEALEKQNQKLKSDIQEMIQKAAAKHLPAYREQGEKIISLTSKVEALEKQNEELRSIDERYAITADWIDTDIDNVDI